MRTIIWFIYFWVSLVFTLPSLARAKYYEKKGMQERVDQIAHKKAKAWMGQLLWLSGGEVVIHGREQLPPGPKLFVSNHQGNFDIPLLMTSIQEPLGFIAKIETKKLPFIGTWMRYLHCVFMDRKDFRQSIKAINEGASYLREGYSLVIFPEGTRSRTGQLLEFKHGSLKLATKAKVPIIPTTIKGTINKMPKDSLWIKPARVDLTFGKPLDPADFDFDTALLTEKVYNEIKENLQEIG